MPCASVAIPNWMLAPAQTISPPESDNSIMGRVKRASEGADKVNRGIDAIIYFNKSWEDETARDLFTVRPGIVLDCFKCVTHPYDRQQNSSSMSYESEDVLSEHSTERKVETLSCRPLKDSPKSYRFQVSKDIRFRQPLLRLSIFVPASNRAEDFTRFAHVDFQWEEKNTVSYGSWKGGR